MKNEQVDLSESDISEILQRIGPLEAPPDDMKARVKSAVRESWQEEVYQSRRPQWPGYAAAVAIMTATAYFGLTIEFPEPIQAVASLDSDSVPIEWSSDGAKWQSSTEPDLVAGTFIRAVQPVSLSFQNGMNTRLNAGTTIELSDPDEIRLINGEVYLDSYKRSAAQAFTVQTAYGSAVDIGTQFMVSSRSNGWSVQVREGRVQMQDDALLQDVTPGVRLTVAEDNTMKRLKVAPHDGSWSWTEKSRPAFDIEGKKVETYLEWVARETGRELQFARESAASRARNNRLHGTIVGHSASDSLANVLQTTDLQLLDADEHIILVDVADPR